MQTMKGQLVTVMGLGRHGGGVGAARWLVEQGGTVTVTDLETAERLADSLARLQDLPIRYTLGRHDEADFRGAHRVVVNPAVMLPHPLVTLANESGAAITSEVELFLDRCKANVVGVTGTTGKSTTCTMLAEMLRHSGRRTWLGGNIGHSLLCELRGMHASDVVVLELSSFQLAHLSRTARLPQAAIITNCRPNHLDWHGSWTRYRRAKQRILAGSPGQIAVVNSCDPEVSSWREIAAGEVVPLIEDSWLPELRVPGLHNRQNARLAATMAARLGADPRAIQAALASFAGLPHRLEPVAQIAGRRFLNDSKATSAAAAIAALHAIDGPIWLLAGGVHRGDDWRELARHIACRTRGGAFFGQARHNLSKAVQSEAADFNWVAVEHLAEAAAWAFDRSREGDAILLSPACPSFDQFADFAERGRRFAELAHDLSHNHDPHRQLGPKPMA